MSTKRKRAVLSIKDKQIIISRLDKGKKGTNLAQEFGISKQHISDIRKNKDKILKFTDSIETSEGLNRKSLKLADDKQLDKALYAWFVQQRSSGTPISGPLLQEKAKDIKRHQRHRKASYCERCALYAFRCLVRRKHGIYLQGVR